MANSENKVDIIKVASVNPLAFYSLIILSIGALLGSPYSF